MNQNYIIFTGRPNAGKSIIIKKITGLDIKSGKYPGTTSHINLHPLSKKLIIVDMPGYGRISKKSRKTESMIKNMIIEFIENYGSATVLTIHIIDASTFLNASKRLEQKGIIPIDIEMINFLRKNTDQSPIIVLNKIDKIQQNAVKDCEVYINNTLESSEEVKIFQVSAKNGDGIGLLKKGINDHLLNMGFKNPFKHPK